MTIPIILHGIVKIIMLELVNADSLVVAEIDNFEIRHVTHLFRQRLQLVGM